WLGVTSIELDELGRAKRVTDYSGKKVEYGFGPDGERTSIKYPDDKIVEYEYDGALRLKTLIDGDKRIGYMYDENSRLHEKVFPNGTSAKYSYNEAGLLSELSSSDRDGLLDKYAYSYDNMSNTVRIEKYRRGLQEENGQYQYTYDALSRLTGVTKDDSLIRKYGYDEFGNRSYMVDGGVRTDYTYNPLNQLLRLENVGLRQDFIYDARGNLTRVLEDGRFKNSYEFDPMNRLAKAESAAGQTAFYDYNGLGNRVKRRVTDGVDPTKEISYVLDLTKQYHNLLQTTSKDGQTRNYAWDSNVASENIGDGDSRYYLNDELGSPLRLTHSDGALAESYAYDEFGADRTGNQGLTQPFGFTGYQYDGLAGSYFAQAREYNPLTSRWLSPDPLLSTGYNPNDSSGLNIYNIMQSANLYVFCLNNPLRWIDPSGMIIELSGSATKEEIEQYNRAIEYLKTSDVGKTLIEKLENANEVFTIMFVYDDNMYYDPSTREIFFDIFSGLITGDGTSIQSAALGLAHEMGHGAQHLDGEMDTFLNNPTKSNRDKLEAANLKTYETPMAKQLGEPVRKNYTDVSGLQRMNNSTHYRTTWNRPWYQYIWPGNWGKPGKIITDHNS
ncbi:MAG: hypothetical protein FWH57_06120, partial [Oscillospiraceae bacterium]|nr:hypothetical protein [Oscillospiraceae bacterium]